MIVFHSYEAALGKFLHPAASRNVVLTKPSPVAKSQSPQSPQHVRKTEDARAAVCEARVVYETSRFELVCALNLADYQVNFDLAERLLTGVSAFSSFFHQGMAGTVRLRSSFALVP
jgi:hypothetical protein